jgi:peroxiredoxin (alkyl hydroperoxide reductase subunit C)
MKLTVEVLHGKYIGDVQASVYKKGEVRYMPDILTACRELGVKAVQMIQEKEVTMKEMKDGCVKPALGPIVPSAEDVTPIESSSQQEVTAMQARVGMEAPDFEANAFVEGEGFKPVKLSDFKGKWIVLCFYPGDFTFV